MNGSTPGLPVHYQLPEFTQTYVHQVGDATQPSHPLLSPSPPSAVILEHKKIKSATVSPSISHEVMGPDVMILVFWMLSFKPTFSLSFFTYIQQQMAPQKIWAKGE